MSAEVVGGWLLKLAWAPFLTYFWYNVNKEDRRRSDREKDLDKRIENVYTKESVNSMVSNQNALLRQRQEHMEARMSALESYHVSMLEKNDENGKKIFSSIAEIKTDVAVITNSLNNIRKGE